MNRILIFFMVIGMSLSKEAVAQCTFSTPSNSGFLCDEARYLCGFELDGFQGSLLETLSPLPQPDPICGGNGSPENTQWFSFVADDNNLEINISYSNCTNDPNGPGLSVGIYKDCTLTTDLNNPLELICETSTGYSTINLIPDPAEIQAGSIYFLYIDGYAGAACDFEIDVVSGVCIETSPPDEPCAQDCGVSNTFGDYRGCTGINEIYTFQPSSQIIEDLFGCNPFISDAELDSIICIEWEISPSTGFTINNETQYFDSLDVRSIISVSFDTPGTYMIKPILHINPLFATCRAMCLCTDNIAYTVDITESVETVLDTIFLCPGECADYCGQTVCSDATITCIDRNNCTKEIQVVQAQPIQFVDLGEYYICDGNCFIFNEVPYCTPNIFSVPSLTSCDTSYTFELIDLLLDVNLVKEDSVIDCTVSTAELQGEWATNYPNGVSTYWLNENGDTISYTSDYIATEAGIYSFVVVPNDLEGCSVTIDHQVIKDDAIPEVMLQGPDLDCSTMNGQIVINSNAGISSASWSGPNGFMFNGLFPMIDEGGTYTVDIVADNGCTITQMIEIEEDFEEPVVQISNDDIDCSDNMHTASFISSLDVASVVWTEPNGNENTDDILNLSQPGLHTVLITATNGCTAIENFTVQDLAYNPSTSSFGEVLLRCGLSTTDINLDGLNANYEHVWTNLATNETINSPTQGSLTFEGPSEWVLSTLDQALGCIGYDTVKIITDDNPFLDVELETFAPLCDNQSDGSVNITSFMGGSGPFIYEYDGSTFDNFENIQFETGTHSMTITDIYGCDVTKIFDIPTSEKFEVITETEVSIKYSEIGELSASANIPDSEILSITWTDVEGNEIGTGENISVSGEDDIVIVTVENLEGCTASATILIRIDYEVEIFHPNVFSPNGDGKNDIFLLYNSGQPEMIDELKIYDRAGELVFEQATLPFNESASGWDGTFNNKPVVPGVYVFVISYTLGNGKQRSLSGSITVVR